jgi:hypothetical protein
VVGFFYSGNEPSSSIKCGGISSLAKDIFVSQEGPHSMQLVSSSVSQSVSLSVIYLYET